MALTLHLSAIAAVYPGTACSACLRAETVGISSLQMRHPACGRTRRTRRPPMAGSTAAPRSSRRQRHPHLCRCLPGSRRRGARRRRMLLQSGTSCCGKCRSTHLTELLGATQISFSFAACSSPSRHKHYRSSRRAIMVFLAAHHCLHLQTLHQWQCFAGSGTVRLGIHICHQ